MFLSEKIRIFRTQAQKENCVVSKRSEFRLKSVVSSLDLRTWSFNAEDRRKAFLESINNPGIHFGNYVPFIELLQILGIKKAFLLREPRICEKQTLECVESSSLGEVPSDFNAGVPPGEEDLGETPQFHHTNISNKESGIRIPCDIKLNKEPDLTSCQAETGDAEVIKKEPLDDSYGSCQIKYDNTVKFHSYDKVSSLLYQDQEMLIENIKYSQGIMSQPCKVGVSSKHSNVEMNATTLIVPNNSINSAAVGQEAEGEEQEIKVHAIIESYNKMKLHLEKLIPVAIEKDNLESELVEMSDTIKDLTKVISYQDTEINRLINILQSNQEMMVRQDKNKPKSDFCQMVPSTDDNDQMYLHMISVNSNDKNQQLYFYQLQISLNQERKNFNKLLKLLRIEQETRKNIQQELNKQLRKATELAVERDLLRKTLQYNEKTVQRYMLESETEKEKAKLLEHSLAVLEQQLERIERSLQTDIENCKTLQSQQIVDRIQKHIKDSKKLNMKLLGRNHPETWCVPSRSDTELCKPFSSMSKIVFSKRDIIQTPCCGDDSDNDEEGEQIKLSFDKIYKNRNVQYLGKKRKPVIRSSDSLSRCVMKQTSIIFEKSEPESGGKPCATTSSNIKIHNEMNRTVSPGVEELYKRLKSTPQQLEMQEISAERVISKVSLGKTRAKDELYDSEITLLRLKNTRSSTRARKNSRILKQKDSDMRIPSKHKSDARRKPHVSAFYPKSLELPSKRKNAEIKSERRKVIKTKSRIKVGETGLLDKFYPEDKKLPSSKAGLKTPRRSASVVLPVQKSVSSCDLEIHARLARTRARLQEIYDKYSDCKNEFTRRSKTFILDKFSSTHALPIQESHHVCTSVESFVDHSKNYKTTFSSSQKQIPSAIQTSYHQTYVTDNMQRPCDGRVRTKYLAIYSGDSIGTPATSKFIVHKPYPQTTTPTVANKHLICSSKHSLKTTKFKDYVTDSFHHDVNIDVNCGYKDHSTSTDKYCTKHTYKQETPIYSNKDLYKKYATGGSSYCQTTSQDKLFTSKQSYLLEKPSYRQLNKYEGYYRTETSVTDFQNKNKKPLKYSDVMNGNIIADSTKYAKNKSAQSSSKKRKKKIQFENNRAKSYEYELPESNKYPRQDREDYPLPEKDNMHAFTINGGKNFCTVCDSNFERKYNITNALSPSNNISDVCSKTNINYTVKDWKQTTMIDQKDSNYYKDMFTRNRETSYQLLDRIHKQNSSMYQTNRDQVYPRQGTPDLYKVRTVTKRQEPLKPTMKESYYKRPLDPYSKPDTTTVRSQVSAYSARKPPNLTTSEYIEYLKAKHARRTNTFT